MTTGLRNSEKDCRTAVSTKPGADFILTYMHITASRMTDLGGLGAWGNVPSVDRRIHLALLQFGDYIKLSSIFPLLRLLWIERRLPYVFLFKHYL